MSLSIFLLTLTACNGKQTLKDGNYEGNYKDDTSSVKVYIIVKDGKLLIVKGRKRFKKWKKWDKKDENYAKDDADFNYKIAQKAVKNSQGYAKTYWSTRYNQVDLVRSDGFYQRFKEVVKDF